MVVSVPIPDRVPLSVIAGGMLGLFPRGRLQLLAIVLVSPEVVNLTKLKTALLQVMLALMEPSKIIVPPLALKVTPAPIVKCLANVAVPLGAVKLPESILNSLLISNVV